MTDAEHALDQAPEYAPLPANVRTGFAARASAADPGPGSVALFWLGQAGILLKSEDVTLLIDPFLCQYPARLVPPADAPEALAFVDYVLATHEHLDHLDLAAWRRLAAATEAIRFVAPRAILDQIASAGIDPARVTAADPGEALELGAATVVPIRGVHGISMETGYTDGTDHPPGLPRFLGYVIDLAGIRIYHAGDTIFFDGLVEQLADHAIDVALLPINGRDHLREKAGLVGNMGPREAADLAAAIGAKVVVPLHWDLMAGNTEEPGHFVDYLSRTYPEITALVLGRFAGVTLGKPV